MNNRKFGKLYFNGNKSGYKKGYQSLDKKSRWEPIINEIFKFKTNGKILDVGCAYGFFLKFLPDFEKYGIDISSYALERSRKISNLKFFNQDIQNKTNFKNNFFDVLTAFAVLEHLDNLENALLEMKRILKKDGFAFFTFPNTDCFYGRRMFNNDKTHKNDSKKLKKEIKKHFDIKEEKYIFYLDNSHQIISSKLPNFLRLEYFIIAKPIK